jgi:hypothetical protein
MTSSLFKSGRLSRNIKLTLYKGLISSVMTYACTARDDASDARLLKLQRLQNRVFCSIGNPDTCTPVRELHVAFKILYVYDYVTKLCRTQAEVILNRVNLNVRGIGKEKPGIRRIRVFILAVPGVRGGLHVRLTA